MKETVAARTQGIRRAARRNRVLLVTLFAVGGVFIFLTGISLAEGEWQVTQLNSPNFKLPPPRFGAATAYVGNKQEVLIFGGFVGTTSVSNIGTVAGPPIVTDGQTWAFKNGGDWQLRKPLHAPAPRGFAAMAYDGARRNVVLFGGAPYRTFTGSDVSSETWTWDPEERDWALQHPPEPIPEARQNAVMAYDAHRRVVVMFGGRGADSKPLGDTWTWNGSRWTIMPRVGSPSPRHSAAMAYDECRAEAVMFGGIGDPVNNFVPQSGETWTWNGAKWSPEVPKLSPPRRVGASMAYSPRRGRVLLYGGLATSDAGVPAAATDTDVWRWNEAGATGWEKMNTEATTAGTAWCAVWILAPCDLGRRGQPAPRAYASFALLVSGSSGDSIDTTFSLYGGTPALDASSIHSGLGSNVPQVALGDENRFFEGGASGGVPNQQGLLPRCVDPVPLPPEDAVQIDLGAEARNKLTAREGVREIAQLPVLLGTDWPQANRDTHLYGTPPRPNPNYIPAPDCPNRAEGETGKNTYLVTDPKRNRVYQFFACDGNRGNNEKFQSNRAVANLLIEAYDGNTLKPIGRVVLRNVKPPGGSNDQAGLLLSSLIHDTDQGRFLLRSSYYNGSTTVNELVDVRQDLIEKGVDPIAGRSNIAGTPLEINDFDNLSRLALPSRFFNHPKTGRAKMFFKIAGGGATVGPPPAQSTPPKLAQWDIEGRREDWRVELTGCSLSESSAMRSGDRVYTTCISSNRTAAVRIPVVEDPSVPAGEKPGTPEPPFPGPVSGSFFGQDPQAERMLLFESNSGGQRIWVFDGKVSRWVGRVGITSNSSLATVRSFDRDASRLYVQLPDSAVWSPGQPYYPEQGGLLMVDTGLTPIPQPLKFPQLASFPVAPIASLPAGPDAPHRIFMRRTNGNMMKYPDGETVKMPNEMFYRVLADEVPLPEKPDLAQLDALTIPVAETPGKTEASFDAEGSGYGIRLRSVGGIQSALRPFAQAYAGNGEFAEYTVLGYARHAVPGCVFPDRELMAGWVPQARLSDLDALARSSGLEVDSNSKTDLEGPFSRCNPSANASNFPPSIKVVFDVLWPLWQMVQLEGNKAANSGTVEVGKDADGTTTKTDTQLGTLYQGQDGEGKPTVKYDGPTSTSWNNYFKEVECVGDALATNQATVGNIYGSANCVQKKGLVEATAKGSASGTGLTSSSGFSVGEGYSTVTVTREPGGKGVVVTANAVATGIKLPGAPVPGAPGSLSIDRVETRAEAWSNGRPSDEENPRASFTRYICGVHTPDYSIARCLTAAEQKQLVDNWNARWGVNSKMYLPEYDPELYRGSPGGYTAGVIKPVAIEVEDQFFAKDFLREVPGLVIEFVKDSPTEGLGRQVLQLAAVRAVAGLGVQCNSELVYSPTSNSCIALNFEDDPLGFEEDEEEFFEDADDAEFESDGEWIPVEASGTGEPLTKKIGRLLNRLPVFSRLPIRQMGEALLGASVWLLLLTPLGLATRRFALLNLARKV